MKTNTQSRDVLTNFTHPLFDQWMPDWIMLNDTIDGGSTVVKEAGRRYLPATSGQIAQWTKPIQGVKIEDLGEGRYVYGTDTTSGATVAGQGAYAYHLYKFRANFFEYPSATVGQMVGRLISEEATIKLPTDLSGMEDNATTDGKGMQNLIESIYREQCKYSRAGLLADFPEGITTNPPYFCLYGALRILSWGMEVDPETGRQFLKFVVLDDSGYDIGAKGLEYKKKIRVLALDDNMEYFTQVFDITGKEQTDLDDLEILVPQAEAKYPLFKEKKSKQIPFVFFNATNNNADPELAIAKGVTEMALAIYRGEADYRQALFMQGQATPAFKGVSPEDAREFMLGANGGVASTDENFEASYMEVGGKGLTEMRESQDGLHKKAVTEGMKLIEAGKNESGEALKERTDSQTISLSQIATTCEDGLLSIFKILTTWGGISGEVVVEVNREFTSGVSTPDELFKLVQAYNSGFPMTKEDMHKYAVTGGLSEATWEEVQQEMADTGRDGSFGGMEEEAEEDEEESNE